MRAESQSEVQRWIESNPGIRAGEPVVRGTRVPVYVLADIFEQGASREELLEDYPSVSPQALDAALAFARAHPRLDRPGPGAWRSARV